jgi:hypothetical protein
LAGKGLESENILKVTVNKTRDSSLKEQPQGNITLQSQKLKVTEAITDLSRGAGDISLYGKIPTQCYNSLAFFTNLSLLKRLLYPICWISQYFSVASLHFIVFILCNIPTILAKVVD